MGLSRDSMGANSIDRKLEIKKLHGDDKVIAIAGNPNVGKSTVFNHLTGMKQHTGNWPGKTVTNAQGWCSCDGENYVMIDIPGTYSLMAHSAEEEVARDFICFGEPDAVVVICDATCLERNLNLVLQILEITKKAVVCVNLIDEAERKKIHVDIPLISELLGTSVVGAAARNGDGIDSLMTAVKNVISDKNGCNAGKKNEYSEAIERAVEIIEPVIFEICGAKINSRWLALRLLDADDSLICAASDFVGFDIAGCDVINEKINEAKLVYQKISPNCEIRDEMVSSIVKEAEKIARKAVTVEDTVYSERDRKLDKILTGKLTGIPIMIVLLAVIFWITITGANYPSSLLSRVLFRFEEFTYNGYLKLNLPVWIGDFIIRGVYRVLAWVVSVMLPPMAIFFPLFTLLEDLGYLPRIAFNLDSCFKRCSACGKQALTICMVSINLYD